jgi:predicted amidohydrolase YtcJ
MKLVIYLAAIVLLSSCNRSKEVDLIIYNAKVYTVDEDFTVAEAFAVKDGKIVGVGTSEHIRKSYQGAEEVDAGGKAVYPGFIDGHSHFVLYGEGLQQVDLTGTTSWQEVLSKVSEFAEQNPNGWIIGNGWDQNDWDDKSFPENRELNELFPGRPVFLSRVDGHAAIVNEAAIQEAELKAGTKLVGGEVETVNGKLTGILIDNAINLVARKIPAATSEMSAKALIDAQRNCFAVGLTSVTDCGLDHQVVEFIDSMQRAGDLKMRMYVMLSDKPANYEYAFKKGLYKTNGLNVRSFKVFADGALGSRGACLLSPYSDKPGHSGFLLSDKKHFEEVAQRIFDKGFQMCTHAIGDSANREILNVYGRILKGKNDKRWRIEHAQVISPDDFGRFAEFSVIPSVQSTHATSDMYWAGDRLGAGRLKGAYAYKNLLKQNGWLVLGTDFPVENIDPLNTFYAATVRKDAKGYPAGGFQSENALSREEALRGMTIWAAKGNFEESEKGSLEPGKFADFVVMDIDLMHAKPGELLKNKVLKTYLGGEKVYER